MRVDKSKWKKKRLGELCEIKRGGSPRPIHKYLTDDPQGINWIKIGDAGDSKYISSCKEKIIPEGMKKSRFVHKGDFLLSNSMSFGRPYILNVDGCIHDGWLVLEKPTAFDTSFLYYLLGSPLMYEKFAQKAQGAVVNNLNIERVAGVEVAYPSIEEQCLIAQELDAIQAMIDGYREQVADLDALAQSIFLETFGDPISNPKGWEVKKFSQIISLKSGDGLSAKNFIAGEFPVYGGNGIAGYHNAYNKEGEFIIIGRVGALCGNVRKVKDRFWLTDNAFELILKQETFDLTFLSRLLVLLNLGSKAKKMAQPVISNVSLKDVIIPIPPLPLQQQFAAQVEAIEKQKDLLRQQIADAETLMAERMQYYFS